MKTTSIFIAFIIASNLLMGCAGMLSASDKDGDGEIDNWALRQLYAACEVHIGKDVKLRECIEEKARDLRLTGKAVTRLADIVVDYHNQLARINRAKQNELRSQEDLERQKQEFDKLGFCLDVQNNLDFDIYGAKSGGEKRTITAGEPETFSFPDTHRIQDRITGRIRISWPLSNGRTASFPLAFDRVYRNLTEREDCILVDINWSEQDGYHVVWED